MKTQLQLAALAVLVSTLNPQLSTAFAQGSLTPPGAPASTMKTLAQIEPRTPISSLPYTISSPGSYYLTTNLTTTSGNPGINISSGNVTVDLGGFTLQGVPGSGVGLHVTTTYTNVTVRNGTISGWGSHGIDAYTVGFPRNLLFEHLTLSANGSRGLYTHAGSIVRDCLFIGNASDGITSAGGDIIRCISRNNGGSGISANNCTVQDCRSEYNAIYGIYLNQSRALNCAVENNSNLGFWLDNLGNQVRGCRVVANAGRGVYCNTGSGGNIITDNLIANNTDWAIQVSGNGSLVTGNNITLSSASGIVIFGNNNRIDNNNVQANGSLWGIGVNTSAFTNNVVIRNTVAGSSVNYYNPGSNDFGPIGSAATATSPWANISH